MRRFTLGIVLSVALLGCGEKQAPPPAKGQVEKQPAADIGAGKAFAERECRKIAVAFVERPAVGAVALRRRRAQWHDAAAGVVGEQDAGFLERFADRRDPVREPPSLDPERAAGRGIIPAHAQGVQSRSVIGGVERAARKHMRAGHELQAHAPLQHQHLHPARRVADERHGGGWLRRDLFGLRIHESQFTNHRL